MKRLTMTKNNTTLKAYMKSLWNKIKSIFVKKKYKLKTIVETRNVELGMASLQIKMHDGGIHHIDFRGKPSATVVNEELTIKVKSGEQYAKEWIVALNNVNENDLIPVVNEEQKNITYRRRSEIKQLVLTPKEFRQDKTFKYKIREEIKNV